MTAHRTYRELSPMERARRDFERNIEILSAEAEVYTDAPHPRAQARLRSILRELELSREAMARLEDAVARRMALRSAR